MRHHDRVHVNFFRPKNEKLRGEVAITRVVLLLWLILSFGIPLAIWIAGEDDLGTSWFTETQVFGFPLHYWLLAQGCTIGYVALCKLYCYLWDRRSRLTRQPPHARH